MQEVALTRRSNRTEQPGRLENSVCTLCSRSAAPRTCCPRRRAVIAGARDRALSRHAIRVRQRSQTPIFEFTEVFARPIGEHTDIVAKEMYSLKDRGGEDLSLRPEYTAGVVRAVLSNGLTQSAPLKFF